MLVEKGLQVAALKGAAVLAVLALLCLLPGNAFGQSSTGQIKGTVSDQTGAVLPGATVTATNTVTGESRETTTNEVGDYNFKLVQPGTYKVQVKADGFKQASLEDLVVRITETAIADVKLEVGAETSEIVTVKAEAPLVRLDSASVGQVIEERSIKQLPLPTRNFQQLLTLTAGTSSNITNTSEVGRGDTAINVNGQRTTSNSVLINGID
ncbi:MAG: carboxypeptidase regulatory-like domain-containing protein, partial [Blastocatellia bacterium]|nr:carboxypeptidase regulatory-like domain-containing protein [Blastocatellia bacterium]